MIRPSLHLTDLTVRRNGRAILSGISATAPAGAVTALLGPNGAGKSTVLKAVAGLLPIRGHLRLDTVDLAALPLRDRARRIGYLPQDHRLHWPIPVRDVVRLGLLARPEARDSAAAVAQAMRATEVEALADRPATALSGGERARVHLARVLAGQPDVILADEPVAALDPAHQIAVMTLLRQQAVAQGRCVVVVLHDLTLAARFCDQVLLLRDGCLIAAAPPHHAMTPDRLAALYETPFLSGQLGGQTVILPMMPADGPLNRASGEAPRSEVTPPRPHPLPQAAG